MLRPLSIMFSLVSIITVPTVLPKTSETGIDIILLGNPGVGKSTIGSSLSGGQMKSGVAFGGGLTRSLQFVNDKKGRDIRWADTPGLSDIDHSEHSANAIYKALEDARKRGRGVKLIFVCNDKGGRIVREDIFTINEVMNSIKFKGSYDNTYTVLFNKFNKNIWDSQEFQEKGQFEIEQYLLHKSAVLNATTKHIKYVLNHQEIDGLDNQRLPSNVIAELEDVIVNKTPTIFGITKVSKIDTRNLDDKLNAQKEAFKKSTAELKADYEKNIAKWKKIGMAGVLVGAAGIGISWYAAAAGTCGALCEIGQTVLNSDAAQIGIKFVFDNLF